VHSRFLASVAVITATLVCAPSAAAVLVHVRVEGKTRTIFGATQPLVDVPAACPNPNSTNPAPPCAPTFNALGALDTASTLGEFYYHVTVSGFGPYVDQIGLYPAVASSGWAFKVDGVSPPVGANAVQVKPGDTVLWYWADFGPSGGPPTLVLHRSGRCYTVLAQDDNGKTSPAVDAQLHVGSRRTVSVRNGRACVGPHAGLLVRATVDGAVRSNALP
jgi:hypothetical protein